MARIRRFVTNCGFVAVVLSASLCDGAQYHGDATNKMRPRRVKGASLSLPLLDDDEFIRSSRRRKLPKRRRSHWSGSHGGANYLGCLGLSSSQLRQKWKFPSDAPNCDYTHHSGGGGSGGGSGGGGSGGGGSSGGGGGGGYDDDGGSGGGGGDDDGESDDRSDDYYAYGNDDSTGAGNSNGGNNNGVDDGGNGGNDDYYNGADDGDDSYNGDGYNGDDYNGADDGDDGYNGDGYNGDDNNGEDYNGDDYNGDDHNNGGNNNNNSANNNDGDNYNGNGGNNNGNGNAGNEDADADGRKADDDYYSYEGDQEAVVDNNDFQDVYADDDAGNYNDDTYNGNDYDPFSDFDIEQCDTYENLWLWDLSLTCGSEENLESCECVFAEELMTQGYLGCEDMSSCPRSCPICKSCLEISGCPSLVNGGSVSSARGLFALLAVAVGVCICGVVIVTRRFRRQEPLEYGHFMQQGLMGDYLDASEESFDQNETTQEPVWLAPAVPPTQFEPSVTAALAASGSSETLSSHQSFPSFLPSFQASLSAEDTNAFASPDTGDDNGDIWLAPVT